jgi:hypothetical protein
MPDYESAFPAGTTVRVKHAVLRRGRPIEAEVTGVVEAWEDRPTGSWYAHGKNDKLWLKRLKLRKADGEVTLLVIDTATEIAKREPADASPNAG